jgi:pimeloyl-ACP methyl ester carboxylesterase
MQTFLEIPVGRQRLAASLHWPERDHSAMGAPVAICCHGLTGTRIGSCYRFVTLARQLVAENIACLRFDFRGCGESDGEFQDLCVPSLVEDFRAVIAAVDGLPGCDPTRIGIVASSFGAFTASHMAAEIPALRCLVFWAPVADAKLLIQREMNDAAWDLLRSQGWIEHYGHRLGARFFDTLPEADAPESLARCGRPVLIYHGKGDQWVSVEHSRAYERAVQKARGNVWLELVDVSEHAMRSVAANETIINGTVGWLRRFLHPAEPPSIT